MDIKDLLVDNIGCGVLCYALPKRDIVAINSEAKRILGLGDTDKDKIGDIIYNSVLDSDKKTISRKVKVLQNDGDSVVYQYRRIEKEKDKGKEKDNIIYVECTSKLLIAEGVSYILTTIIDITAEKEVNNLLSKERSCYQDALLTNSFYSFSFNLTQGTIINDFYMTRQNGEREAGGQEEEEEYKASYITGLTFPCRYDDFIDKVLNLFDVTILSSNSDINVYRIDLLKAYNEGKRHIELEIYSKVYKKYLKYSVLLSSEDGVNIKAILIAYDVTEERLAEIRRQNDLIRANEYLHNQMRLIRSFSSIYFATWNLNLKEDTMHPIAIPSNLMCITEENKDNLRKSMQYMIDKFISKNPNVKEPMQEFLDIGTVEERIEDSNLLAYDYNSYMFGWVSANFIVVERDEYGRPFHLIYAIRNINKTKIKEIEQEEMLKVALATANKANEAKTQFLSNMSHDIRTPMNAIIGMTTIARAHIDDKERLTDCFDKITISSHHLLDLINEVLDMSKIESGTVHLNEEEFNLSQVVDDLLVMIKPVVTEKRQTLDVFLNGIVHERMWGDVVRIERVFTNILGNCIKYTGEGGKISVTIKEHLTTNKGVSCFEIVFKDNGRGMDKEYLSHIFEPFSREDNKNINAMQGTGLGMAIAKNIVNMMNGDIKVNSEVGRGTTFTVTIYLKTLEESKSDKHDYSNLSVLVVDDDIVSCESAAAILTDLGIKNEWVLSGEEALERAIKRNKEGRDYFALIVDWQMPNMDGLTLTREVRKKVGKHIPIIVLSSYDFSAVQKEAVEAGVNVFISKPIFKSKILQLFNSLLTNGGEEKSNIQLLEEKRTYKDKRILLVEDNELNREIASEILSMMGFIVEEATNGEEAIKKVLDSPPQYFSLIFMDIQMPVMDGYAACKAIRASGRKDLQTLPIIAMTANAFTEDVILSTNAGMNEHISKPLELERVEKVLERWIK